MFFGNLLAKRVRWRGMGLYVGGEQVSRAERGGLGEVAKGVT